MKKHYQLFSTPRIVPPELSLFESEAYECLNNQERKSFNSNLNLSIRCGFWIWFFTIFVAGFIIFLSLFTVHKFSLKIPDNDYCYEYVTIRDENGCNQLSIAYGLNRIDLQTIYDCDSMQIGDSFCISKNFTCQHRFEIEEGDTCEVLKKSFQANQTELEEMNRGVKCDNLPVGRMMCVWSADDRKLPNMTCTKWTNIEEEGNNCYDVARDNALTIDYFKFMNPRIKCPGSIPIGRMVCVRSQSTNACSSIKFVNKQQSCAEIEQYYQISSWRLMHLNPTLRCDRVEKSEQICIGIGPFKQEGCVSSQRVTPENENCEKLSKITGLSKGQIEDLNPGTNCGKNFEWGSLICISGLGTDTRSAQQLIVTSLKDIAPNLSKKFDTYVTKPNKFTEKLMNEELITDLLKPSVVSKLKELYRTDESIRKILDSQHPLPRQSYCENIMKTQIREDIKRCFCGNDELLIYCQVLASKMFMDNRMDGVKTYNMTSLKKSRVKRSLFCSASTPLSKNSKLAAVRNTISGCVSVGCSYPIPPLLLELNLQAEICIPLIKATGANVFSEETTFCDQTGKNCNTVKVTDTLTMQFLSEAKLGVAVSLCAIGSNAMKLLTNMGLCLELPAAEYYGFVGKLNFGANLNLIILSIEVGMSIKVHELALPNMCRHSKFECEDYCKWTEASWSNGRPYGYFRIQLMKILGFDGYSLTEENFAEPRRIGCNSGEEAAVVLRNERTCKDHDDRVVQRRCWGNDDVVASGLEPGWHIFDKEWGFAFQPTVSGTTRFICQFVTENGQNMEFDVYGGKSKNRGKSTFHYVVKDDGIYYGMEKYKEDQLIDAWIDECKENQSFSISKYAIFFVSKIKILWNFIF